MAKFLGIELPFGKRIPMPLPIIPPELEDSKSVDLKKSNGSNGFVVLDTGHDLKTETSIAPSQLPKVASPVLHFMSLGLDRKRPRDRFLQPEYDLVEIGRAADVDGYCRQAFLKKTALMFKEGFDYIGPDDRTIHYIKARFAQMAHVSGIPHEDLLRRIGSYLIGRSNAFLIKVRDRDASGGKVRSDPDGRAIEPVAAYFPAPPEMMEVSVDNYGKVSKWRLKIPSGQYKDFNPQDVIHFTFDRKEGFIFGTPTVVPVLDDIRALRRIEQDVELLIYHHLFPVFHYKVGTPEAPAGLTQNGEKEIDVVKKELQLMPIEGGIVTPERHEIDLLGSESRALRIEPYLEHFKRRVWAGLGISSVDVGEADTSNRSTSETMSRALIDGVKDFQATLECQFNHFVLEELLQESTFGEDVLKEGQVRLRFREIDLDKQVKLETHAADQFTKNAITYDELRAAQGRQPVKIPEPGEEHSEEDLSEWRRTFWKLFHEPELLIKSIDEAYSLNAQGIVQHPSLDINQEALESAELRQKTQQTVQQTHEKALAKIKKSTKTKKDSVQDNFLLGPYRAFEEILILEAALEVPDKENIKGKRQLIETRMIRDLEAQMYASYISGLGSINGDDFYLALAVSTRDTIGNRARSLVIRLLNDATRPLNLDSLDPEKIRSVFNALKYRTDFMVDVELRKAYNWGVLIRSKLAGAEGVRFVHGPKSDASCKLCLQNSNDILRLDSLSFEDVIPTHASCSCSPELISTISDRTRPQDGTSLGQKSSIWEDSARLERCITKVKRQLKAKNPKMSNKTITSKAWAICRTSLKE